MHYLYFQYFCIKCTEQRMKRYTFENNKYYRISTLLLYNLLYIPFFSCSSCMWNSSANKKTTLLPQNVFQRQFFSKQSLGQNFRISKMFYPLKSSNLHFGINAETDRQVMIISTKIRYRQETLKTQITGFNIYFTPAWSTNQIIKKQECYVQVYQKHGCTLFQYLQSIKQLKIKNMHIILYLLIQLLKKMHQNKVNFKFFDVKTILICEIIKQDTEIVLSNLFCSIFRKVKNNKNDKKITKEPQKIDNPKKKQKNVTFNLEQNASFYTNKKDIQEVSEYLWNLLQQVQWPSSKRETQQLKQLESLIFFMGKQSMEMEESENLSTQLLLKIKQLHKNLLKEYSVDINHELLQFSAQCQNLMKDRSYLVNKLVDQFQQCQEKMDQKNLIENQYNISQNIENHIIQLKEEWKVKYYEQKKQKRSCVIKTSLMKSLYNKQLDKHKNIV